MDFLKNKDKVLGKSDKQLRGFAILGLVLGLVILIWVILIIISAFRK
jgi:hypothetical protein